MKMYAGFENGKIATTNMTTDDGVWEAPEIFRFRTWARKYFDDVREVEIVEVKKK